jgi:hypothetical protein
MANQSGHLLLTGKSDILSFHMGESDIPTFAQRASGAAQKELRGRSRNTRDQGTSLCCGF